LHKFGGWGIYIPPFRLSQPQQAVFGKAIAPVPRNRNSRLYRSFPLALKLKVISGQTCHAGLCQGRVALPPLP